MIDSSLRQHIRCMQPVLLEVPSGDNTGTYPSLILDFTEGASIVVGVPLERGREIRIEPGAVVNVQIARPDGLHFMRTRIIRRDRQGPSLFLEWPRKTERVQRRNHVRVPVLVRTHLWLPVESADATGETPSERLVSGVTLDLSAGGARVALPEPLQPGTTVRLSLHLPGIGDQETQVRVLRAGENEEASATQRHWAAMEFVGMLESVRREITRFVFDVQRDHLRKGAE